MICNYELYADYAEMKQKKWDIAETFAKGLEDPISYLHINLQIQLDEDAMSTIKATEATMRRYADSQSLQRGLEYYHEGAVDNLIVRGNTLSAEVEGSEPEPYTVQITFGPGDKVIAECTCPYEWGGWCKHIVAAMYAYLHEPEAVEERPALEALLSPLNRDSLQALLLHLAQNHPDLIAEMEQQIPQIVSAAPPAASPTLSPTSTPSPSRPAPVDPATVRKLVRSALKSVGQDDEESYYWDDYDGLGDLQEGINPLLEMADAFLAVGDSRGALPILEAITDELISEWDRVEGRIGDGTELFEEIGKTWAEALLTGDLTTEERESWGDTLEDLQEQGEECGADSGLEIAVAAAEQGWDYPPLVRVLQGEITDKGAWEDEAPDYADALAEVRLDILERQGRLQEAAYLAEAESQYDRYTTLLVRLGRNKEAVDYAIDVVSTPASALQLADLLFAQGDPAQAYRIGEHGLTLQGDVYPLAVRLRDSYREQGETQQAARAALTAVKAQPNLNDYTQLQSLAGSEWPTLRAQVLDHLRQTHGYNPSGRVDIFLHEDMKHEALLAAAKGWDSDLLMRVIQAVLTALPHEVLPICKQRAEAIMDAGKSGQYDEASYWVARARDAYLAAGEEKEWQEYKAQLLAAHQRKYKLIPLLKPL